MAAWEQVLLEAALDSPDEVAADLSMLSADERSQLLSGFNGTDAPVPADKTLSQLFEAQAAARPQAACLTEASKTLTYAEVKSVQPLDKTKSTCESSRCLCLIFDAPKSSGLPHTWDSKCEHRAAK